MDNKCQICQKKVYLLERHYSAGRLYHRTCQRDSEKLVSLKRINDIQENNENILNCTENKLNDDRNAAVTPGLSCRTTGNIPLSTKITPKKFGLSSLVSSNPLLTIPSSRSSVAATGSPTQGTNVLRSSVSQSPSTDLFTTSIPKPVSKVITTNDSSVKPIRQGTRSCFGPPTIQGASKPTVYEAIARQVFLDSSSVQKNSNLLPVATCSSSSRNATTVKSTGWIAQNCVVSPNSKRTLILDSTSTCVVSTTVVVSGSSRNNNQFGINAVTSTTNLYKLKKVTEATTVSPSTPSTGRVITKDNVEKNFSVIPRTSSTSQTTDPTQRVTTTNILSTPLTSRGLKTSTTYNPFSYSGGCASTSIETNVANSTASRRATYIATQEIKSSPALTSGTPSTALPRSNPEKNLVETRRTSSSSQSTGTRSTSHVVPSIVGKSGSPISFGLVFTAPSKVSSSECVNTNRISTNPFFLSKPLSTNAAASSCSNTSKVNRDSIALGKTKGNEFTPTKQYNTDSTDAKPRLGSANEIKDKSKVKDSLLHYTESDIKIESSKTRDRQRYVINSIANFPMRAASAAIFSQTQALSDSRKEQETLTLVKNNFTKVAVSSSSVVGGAINVSEPVLFVPVTLGIEQNESVLNLKQKVTDDNISWKLEAEKRIAARKGQFIDPEKQTRFVISPKWENDSIDSQQSPSTSNLSVSANRSVNKFKRVLSEGDFFEKSEEKRDVANNRGPTCTENMPNVKSLVNACTRLHPVQIPVEKIILVDPNDSRNQNFKRGASEGDPLWQVEAEKRIAAKHGQNVEPEKQPISVNPSKFAMGGHQTVDKSSLKKQSVITIQPSYNPNKETVFIINTEASTGAAMKITASVSNVISPKHSGNVEVTGTSSKGIVSWQLEAERRKALRNGQYVDPEKPPKLVMSQNSVTTTCLGVTKYPSENKIKRGASEGDLLGQQNVDKCNKQSNISVLKNTQITPSQPSSVLTASSVKTTIVVTPAFDEKVRENEHKSKPQDRNTKDGDKSKMPSVLVPDFQYKRGVSEGNVLDCLKQENQKDRRDIEDINLQSNSKSVHFSKSCESICESSVLPSANVGLYNANSREQVRKSEVHVQVKDFLIDKDQVPSTVRLPIHLTQNQMITIPFTIDTSMKSVNSDVKSDGIRSSPVVEVIGRDRPVISGLLPIYATVSPRSSNGKKQENDKMYDKKECRSADSIIAGPPKFEKPTENIQGEGTKNYLTPQYSTIDSIKNLRAQPMNLADKRSVSGDSLNVRINKTRLVPGLAFTLHDGIFFPNFEDTTTPIREWLNANQSRISSDGSVPMRQVYNCLFFFAPTAGNFISYLA